MVTNKRGARKVCWCRYKGCVWFDFCLLPSKSQKTNQRVRSKKQFFFSKSRLSLSAKLKALRDLLLVIFGWNCKNIHGKAFNCFSGFYQTVLRFLIAHNPQHFLHSVGDLFSNAMN
jgi:hypothetical protein